MPDWFLIIPGILFLAIAYFIYDAVQKTKAKIEKKLGPAPSEMAVNQLLENFEKRELPKCPLCQSEAFAMLDTDSMYKCDSCNHEFEDVPHI